jgi:hypothetical protein
LQQSAHVKKLAKFHTTIKGGAVMAPPFLVNEGRPVAKITINELKRNKNG